MNRKKAFLWKKITDIDGIVIRKPSYDLATMIDQITSNNLHPEQNFGAPTGKELW